MKRAGRALKESTEEVKSNESGSRFESSELGTASGSVETAVFWIGKKTEILREEEPALTERMRLRLSGDMLKMVR